MVEKKNYLNNFEDKDNLNVTDSPEIKSSAAGKIVYNDHEFHYFGQINYFNVKKKVKIDGETKYKMVSKKKLCLYILNCHTDLSLEPKPMILLAEKLKQYKFGDYTGFDLFNRQWNTKSFKTDSIDFENVKDLFNLIKSKFDMYIDFPNPLDSTFLALWVMGTYFFTKFQTFPYIHLLGFRNSGKTRIIQVASKMVFNGINASNISPSALFRIIEDCKPTLFLDEFEPISEKRKVRSDDEIELLLNSGYKKGGMAIRNVKNSNNEWKPSIFNTYSPKLISNIGGLNQVLSSRCIKIVMIRAKPNDPRARLIINEEDKDWNRIRDGLYHRALVNSGIIEQAYQNKDKDFYNYISNRELELWEPILIMAGYVGDDILKSMLNYSKLKVEDKEVEEDMSESWETKLLNTLVEEFNPPVSNFFKVKDITEKLWEREFVDEENSDEFKRKFLKYKPSYSWVGRTLRKIPNLKFKKPKNISYVYLSKSIIENILSRLTSFTKMNFEEEKEKDNEVQEQFVKENEQ